MHGVRAASVPHKCRTRNLHVFEKPKKILLVCFFLFILFKKLNYQNDFICVYDIFGIKLNYTCYIYFNFLLFSYSDLKGLNDRVLYNSWVCSLIFFGNNWFSIMTDSLNDSYLNYSHGWTRLKIWKDSIFIEWLNLFIFVHVMFVILWNGWLTKWLLFQLFL